jgi:hypothetical protein
MSDLRYRLKQFELSLDGSLWSTHDTLNALANPFCANVCLLWRSMADYQCGDVAVYLMYHSSPVKMLCRYCLNSPKFKFLDLQVGLGRYDVSEEDLEDYPQLHYMYARDVPSDDMCASPKDPIYLDRHWLLVMLPELTISVPCCEDRLIDICPAECKVSTFVLHDTFLQLSGEEYDETDVPDQDEYYHGASNFDSRNRLYPMGCIRVT